jgi:F0F1-type ATP synthase assembly protein I
MTEQDFSELTDEQLLQEAKKLKSNSILNAVLIGAMIGIAVYSIVKKSFGFTTIIPLFLAYKFYNVSKKGKVLEKVLKDRNLR